MVRTGSTTLVLAPLTPDGSQTYLELIAETAPERLNLVALSYTLPPESWATNWEQCIGPLPENRTFFHAGRTLMAAQDGGTAAFEDVMVVDPTDPMEVVAAMEDRLQAWRSTDRQTVVSLQTLTILLQYVDFDTAFRYLHLLVHKIRACDAVGYFQIDPHLHDPEELNTLKALFDAIVEYSESEGQWIEVVADDERLSDPGDGPNPKTEPESPSPDTVSPPASDDGDSSAFGRWVTKAVHLLTGEPNSGTDRSGVDDGASAPGRRGSGTRPPPTSDSDIDETTSADEDSSSGEDLLTDEERIQRLLHRAGGQMRQADLVEESPWSASTVSRKLSRMEDAGQVSRVRIGRENVVFLDGREPDVIGSPIGGDGDGHSTVGSNQ